MCNQGFVIHINISIVRKQRKSRRERTHTADLAAQSHTVEIL